MSKESPGLSLTLNNSKNVDQLNNNKSSSDSVVVVVAVVLVSLIELEIHMQQMCYAMCG